MQALGFDLGWIDIREWWNAMVAFAGPRWAPSFGALVLAGVTYFVIRSVLRRAEKRWAARTETKLDDYAVRALRTTLLLSVVAWALWRLCIIWFLPGEGGQIPRPAEWVVALWLGLVFFPVSKFVAVLLRAVESQVLDRSGGTLDKTALPLINWIVRFLVISLGVILALSHLGVDITPILGGAGVMGLALSLAAKDTLSNLIAGVLLILDRPFQVGDRIELWTAPNETGTWGDVIEIGLRATKVRNPDNLVVVVPNNEIMQRDIINYTMSGEDIRLRIPFSVAYESDLERAKELLVQAASQVKGVQLTPTPFVIVRGFGPSEVNLQLRVWIHEARSRRKISDEITEKALAAFAAEGVEIPYPKRELYIRGTAGPEGVGEVGGGGVGDP